MAESPIGITFQPSAEAAANGPRQAGLEGQGGSDLAQAFKILSLHLPRVLGASAIAPKRLLTSQGSAGVAAPAGVNPYSAVFEALLQSMSSGGVMNPSGPMGRGPAGGGGSGMDIQALASLFGGPTSYVPDPGTGVDITGGAPSGGVPAPKLTYDEPGASGEGGMLSQPSSNYLWNPEPPNPDTQYI